MGVVVKAGQAHVSYAAQQDGEATTHFPLTTGRRAPACHMRVGYALILDTEREHLAVAKSSIDVAADRDGARPLFRFDYERGKGGGYPEAHIQVSGESPAVDAVLARRGRQRPLAKLHFPVGGRRYRPTLEDVIEFLIVEGFVEPRAGWQAVIEATRGEFHRLQLAAAVRRDPTTADRALRAVS